MADGPSAPCQHHLHCVADQEARRPPHRCAHHGHAARSLGIALAILAVLAVAVALYGVGGSARGICGVALSSTLMETVPKHFMGRVQNTIYLAGTSLQLVTGMFVGIVAHHFGLAPAFAIIATLYLCGFVAALIPVNEPTTDRADATAA